METPQQTIGRLLVALETLTREEEHLFNAGLIAQSTAVQERAMPLVTKIASLVTQPGIAHSLNPTLQLQLQTLLKNRRAHYEHISHALETAEQELRNVNAATIRARQLKPVYCTAPADSPALSFSGEA